MKIKKILIVIIVLFTVILSGCTPNHPNVLTADEAYEIKKVTAKEYEKHLGEPYDLEKIEISEYLGEYNGVYVLTLNYGGGIPEEISVTVAGFNFSYKGTNMIDVFYKGEQYLFKEAYEKGILKYEDIEKIYNKYQEIGGMTRGEGNDFFDNGYDYVICDFDIEGLIVVDEDIKKIDIYKDLEYISLKDYENNKQVIEILSKYTEFFDISEYIK